MRMFFNNFCCVCVFVHLCSLVYSLLFQLYNFVPSIHSFVRYSLFTGHRLCFLMKYSSHNHTPKNKPGQQRMLVMPRAKSLHPAHEARLQARCRRACLQHAWLHRIIVLFPWCEALLCHKITTLIHLLRGGVPPCVSLIESHLACCLGPEMCLEEFKHLVYTI